MDEAVLLLDSITDATADMAGKIAVSGSHGGRYPASVASQAGLRAAVFNDAGGGLNNAGAEGIFLLALHGFAAICSDCMSSQIGLAQDSYESGIVSQANKIAITLGVQLGMSVEEAVHLLGPAPPATGMIPPVAEARRHVTMPLSGNVVLAMDSASLATREDDGQIIVTGSHGGLVGGDASRAFKAKARLAVFNDAGFGKKNAGLSRLPILNDRGLAAVTVSHTTCRIGDAGSAIESGTISETNPAGHDMGARIGDRLNALLDVL